MSAFGVLVSTGRRNTYLEQTRWSVTARSELRSSRFRRHASYNSFRRPSWHNIA